jgi:hypothetical protein
LSVDKANAPCPGGIGESTLLRRFAAIADEVGVPAGLIDCKHIEASPDHFLTTAQSVLGRKLRGLPCGGRLVLIIDTFEVLSPLAGWFMRKFLPALPSGTLVVLAARSGARAV